MRDILNQFVASSAPGNDRDKNHKFVGASDRFQMTLVLHILGSDHFPARLHSMKPLVHALRLDFI
jgi:hypothetical protein